MAHPPVAGENRRHAHPPEASQADGEQVRQRARDRFAFLSTLAATFATDHQSEIRSLAREAWKVSAMAESTTADRASAAAASAAFEPRWRAVEERLLASVPSIRVRWTGEGALLDELCLPDGLPRLQLAEGLTSPLVVAMHNASPQSVTMSPRVVSGPPPLQDAAKIAPGDTRLFLLSVVTPAEGMPLEIELTAGGVLKLPYERVAPATLRVRVLDHEAGDATPARLFVLGPDGVHRHGGPFAEAAVFAAKPELELPVPASYRLPFFYVDGVCELRVPPGRVRVTAERGFEHRRPSSVVEATAGATTDVTLEVGRFFDAAAHGWVSGDTHVHWVTEAWNVDLPLAWLATVQRAEDLRVANNLTLLHRTATDAFVKPSQAPMGPVAAFSDEQFHIEMAEEYRNQNLYGHLCLLNLERLILPIGTGPQIAGDDSLDYPINRTAILDARSQGGIVIEAHGTGDNHELPINAIHGLTDAIDQLDPVDYERLLDCGFLLPLSNGSDHPARVVGSARAYVYLDGPFAYEAWVDGIRRGRTFTTSGPLLLLEVAGHGPGEVIVPVSREPLAVRLKAMSRFPLGRVQVIANGRVLAELQTDETEIELTADLPVEESSWVLARASQDDRFSPIWSEHTAITTAVAVHVEGRPVFREAAARDWIGRMQRHLRDIDTKGRFATRAQRNEAAAYVEEAIRRFERRIQVAADGWEIPDTLEAHRERLVALMSSIGVAGHEELRVAAVRAATSLPEASAAVDDLVALQVDINPEARVKLRPRTLPESLVRHRSVRLLVEVHNEAGLQAPLRLRALDRSQPGEQEADWFAIDVVENGESKALLSGAPVEWKLVELRSAEAGTRTVRIAADAGVGTQDLGFRAEVDLVVDVKEIP